MLPDIFKTIKTKEIEGNVFQMIDQEWMLITAGNREKFNTMTASWGGLGVIWHKHIAIIFVRKERYTYQFIEENPYFSLSFFNGNHKDILMYCGTHSGRDEDKISKCGLTTLFTKKETPYFQQASLVLECKKIYFQDIQAENFLMPEIEENYPEKDYHRIYFGEILRVIKR